MGFCKKISALRSDLAAARDAIDEAERDARLFGHAHAGPALKRAWAVYAKLHRELCELDPDWIRAEAETLGIAAESCELRGRLSGLGMEA